MKFDHPLCLSEMTVFIGEFFPLCRIQFFRQGAPIFVCRREIEPTFVGISPLKTACSDYRTCERPFDNLAADESALTFLFSFFCGLFFRQVIIPTCARFLKNFSQES